MPKKKASKKKSKTIDFEKLLRYLERISTDDDEEGEVFEPKDGVVLTYLGERVIQISRDDIITEQGLEHVGEYEFDGDNRNLKIFQEIQL